MVSQKTVAALLIVCLSAVSEDTPATCQWTAADCERLKTHPGFSDNCDIKNAMFNHEVYSCWEECRVEDPGTLCDHDYCIGYRDNCPSTSISLAETSTKMSNTTPAVDKPLTKNSEKPSTTTKSARGTTSEEVQTRGSNVEDTTHAVDSSSAKIPVNSNTTTGSAKEVNAEDVQTTRSKMDVNPRTTTESGKETTSENVVSNIEGQKTDNHASTFEIFSICMGIANFLMFIVIICVLKRDCCCHSRCNPKVADGGTGDSGIYNPKEQKIKDRKPMPNVAYQMENEIGNGDETERVRLLTVDIEQPPAKDEDTQQRASPQPRQRQLSTSDSMDGEGVSIIDQPTIDLLIRNVDHLTRRCNKLFKLLESIPPSIARRPSLHLQRVDEQTDNDQKGFQMVGDEAVTKQDIESLDNGSLTDGMVTALVKQVVTTVSANCASRVLSFHKDELGDVTGVDLIFWLRHCVVMQGDEEHRHIYLAIVEVKQKCIHVCNSCEKNLEGDEKLVEKQLTGFVVNKDKIKVDQPDNLEHNGLYTIMYVQKYLAAIRDGYYRAGQEDEYHLRFLTEEGNSSTEEYREQLRKMINYSPKSV